MDRIYMDHISATPVDPRVLEFASPFLHNAGNPSALHKKGLEAKEAIELARQKVAGLINAEKPANIIFTGGATEANNLAIIGTAKRNIGRGKHMMGTAIEHMSILNPLKDLTKRGFTMELVPVDETGLVDLEKLRAMISPETIVMSVMHANNEIGTIQPIKEISQIVHDRGMYLHVDATASAGKVPIDVQEMGIDLLTLSGNDLGGPQGAGALYIKTGTRIQTIMPGGGQERGLRSGTENIFAIVGMGEAARLAREDMPTESQRLKDIRDQLISKILENDNTYLTGHPEKRLPHHASFRFSFVEGESILLMMDFQGIQISTGSACSSKTLEASHVLLATGLTHEQAHGSMVLTLGRENKPEEVPVVTEATKITIEKLRMLSPITKEGEEYPEEEHHH